MLYQRGPDGNCTPGDKFTHEAYGPIPDAELFQHHNYKWEKPTIVHGWEWSTTFNRWRALVTFADGWHGFTWSKPN